LEAGLIFENSEIVETEINELCQNYPPVPTNDDLIGHENNLNSIIEELNSQCSGLIAELGCYACLESFPPQSVINFMLDSAGQSVQRHVFLFTPEVEVMSYH
jgi:hypothetical protein